MAINVRNKGANGEREVADILQRVVNEVALSCGYTAPRIRRNVEQSQVGGEDLVGLPWFSFEVKRVERVDLDKWWEQTCVQARRKAAGSTSWDALAKGGWRRLAAPDAPARGGGSGSLAGSTLASAEAAGALSCAEGPGAVEARAEAASRLGGCALVVVGTDGAVQRAIGGSIPGDVVGGSPDTLGAIAGGPTQAREGRKLALPSWAGGSMGGVLRALEQVDTVPVAVPGETARTGLGSVGQVGTCERAEEVEKRSLVATNGTREPVLLWRQNRQPWRVRCRLSVCIGPNGETRLVVSDVSLDDWLDVFRGLLRGYLLTSTK